MIYRLALILLLLATPAHALKMGPMMASSTTYAPSAPVSVSGTAGNGQVTVTWSAGTVDGTHSAATSYNLYRSTSSGTETLWQSGVTSPYVDTASNGTSYYYKVQAVNSAGNALSTEAGPYTPTATVYAPNIPVIGTATAGNAQATVAFTASVVDGTHSAATSYTATSSPGGFTATGSASPLTVTGLTNGTAYTFTVTATNTAGTSAASSASNSVTPATVTYIAQANFSSSTLDTGFSSSVTSTGTVTSNSPTGYATINSTANTGAMVAYNTALPSTKTFKIRVKNNFTSAGNGMVIGLFDKASQMTVATAVTNVGMLRFGMSVSSTSGLFVQYINTSGSGVYFSSTNGTWSSSNASWNTGVITASADYVYELESDNNAGSPRFRVAVYQANGTTLITQSDWASWSSVKTVSNSLYLGIGDPFNDADACVMALDYVYVQ